MPPKKRRAKPKPAPARVSPPASAQNAPVGPLQELPPEICSMAGSADFFPDTTWPLPPGFLAHSDERHRDNSSTPSTSPANALRGSGVGVSPLTGRPSSPHTFRLEMAPDADRFLRALRKCTKVTDYRLTKVSGEAPYNCGLDCQWLLSEGRFRLTTLRNAYLTDSELTPVLARQQSNIRILDLPALRLGSNWHSFPVPAAGLPHLIALGLDGTTAPRFLPAARRLRRMQLYGDFDVDLDHEYLTVLGRFSDSLTTLSLVHFKLTRLAKSFAPLAEFLPHLVHLALNDVSKKADLAGNIWPRYMVTQRDGSAQPILEGIHLFHRLETLVLYTYHATPRVFRDYSSDAPTLTPSMRAFGSSLLARNPHLRQVHLGVFDLALAPKVLSPAEIHRTRVCEVTCSLRRGNTAGKILVEDGIGFEFDRVSGFWDS
ncbi:F-box domain-containing protein [Mycena chlorophos]|uniref:F-box domain-containing protein n=1 Tax=Mycena chlorophos TaxID=658473 RepID=A0A8H6STT5_MYCCL|nr:F-box domain-containing protein [Mycena chlorophos]